MFKELTPLLRKGDTLSLTIARENDTQFRVNVMPKLFTLDGEKGEDRKALNTPLSMTATAEELDSPEFAATLNRFTTSTQELRHTIDDVEKAHKEAKANVEKKKPTPKGGTAKGGKSDRKATNAALAVPTSVAGAEKTEPAKPATAEAATEALI